MFQIKQLDHIVLTVGDFTRSVAFYSQLPGVRVEGRSLFFGTQKINLHRYAGELQPAAERPTTGSADFCLLCDGEIEEISAFLQQQQIPIVTGIVRRNGALGPMDSIYIRDPDGNLVELSVLCHLQ